MAVTSPSSLATSPAGVDLLTAATLPLAGISALQSIAEALDVQPGNRECGARCVGGRVVGLRMPPDQEAAAAKGVSAALQGTEVTPERLERFRELVEQGVLSPHVDQVLALDDIARALEVKDAGGVHGKIAIRVR